MHNIEHPSITPHSYFLNSLRIYLSISGTVPPYNKCATEIMEKKWKGREKQWLAVRGKRLNIYAKFIPNNINMCMWNRTYAFFERTERTLKYCLKNFKIHNRLLIFKREGLMYKSSQFYKLQVYYKSVKKKKKSCLPWRIALAIIMNNTRR